MREHVKHMPVSEEKIKVELTPRQARAFIRTFQLLAMAGALPSDLLMHRSSSEPLALTSGVGAIRDALVAQGYEIDA